MLNVSIVTKKRGVMFDDVVGIKEFNVDGVLEIIFLEQTGNTHEDAHAEAWTEIVGFIQDASKVGELDVLAITRKDSVVAQGVDSRARGARICFGGWQVRISRPITVGAWSARADDSLRVQISRELIGYVQLYIPNLCIEHPVERFGEVNGIEDVEDSDAQDDANEVNACLQHGAEMS